LRSLHFQAVTAKNPALVNRVITNAWVSEAFDPNDPPNPQPERQQIRAMWDTGATGSSISASTVAKLALTPTGTQIVSHLDGSATKNAYDINLYLSDEIIFAGIRVAECRDYEHFDFILGMEVITSGDFSITNFENQTWVSFRTPSMARIDYEQEASKLIFSGIGRNDPCPCGKQDADGKHIKYKKCHGAV
jgi:hypothetical protein